MVSLKLKEANFCDIEFLWYLRNQPDVYKYARQNHSVGWQEHIDWIMPIILKTTSKELYLICNNNFSSGQIRLDYNGEEAEISISVSKEFRGKGIASGSLRLIIKKVKRQRKIKRLIAVVHQENSASKNLFEKLDFRLKNKEGKWLNYLLKI
jgi:RimJ/RimL family protein N-acetyltransferase